jgi:hypothetical protein
MENDTIESVAVRPEWDDFIKHRKESGKPPLPKGWGLAFCSMRDAFYCMPDSNDPGEGQQDTEKDERT